MDFITSGFEYSAKTDKALDAIQHLQMTPADYIDLAMACLDQGGLSVQGQAVVRKTIGLDPLREGEEPS